MKDVELRTVMIKVGILHTVTFILGAGPQYLSLTGVKPTEKTISD